MYSQTLSYMDKKKKKDKNFGKQSISPQQLGRVYFYTKTPQFTFILVTGAESTDMPSGVLDSKNNYFKKPVLYENVHHTASVETG